MTSAHPHARPVQRIIIIGKGARGQESICRPVSKAHKGTSTGYPDNRTLDHLAFLTGKQGRRKPVDGPPFGGCGA